MITKKILHYISHIFWFFIYIGAAIYIAIFLYFILDVKGSCASDGDVWDSDENRCRDDCLTWHQNYGCIKLTPEQMQLFDKSHANLDYYVPEDVYRDICFNNHKAWNLDEQYCEYNFKFEDCQKLNGNWEYPEFCKNE